MASISPRAPGFWTSTISRSTYTAMHLGDDIDVEVADELVDDSEYDGRTPLDKTIDRIGMGACSVFTLTSVLILCLAQGATSGHSCRYVDSVSFIPCHR